MNKLILALALVAGSAATAHESDVVSTVTQQQIEKAKELPQTVVIRRNLKDPKDVAVVHLGEKLAPNTKLSKAQFEKIALNAEVTGIAFDSTNEKDARSSTSSWAFGVYGRGPYGGVVAAGAWGRPGYGYGGAAVYARPGYGYGGGYGYNDGYYGGGYAYGYGGGGGCYNNCYAPVYNYGGYQYNYASYYSYQSAGYAYDYCGWNY